MSQIFILSVLANEKEQREAAREREELQRHIEENQHYEAEQAGLRWQRAMDYQQDLVDQMAYNSRNRQENQRLELEEFLKAQQAEREYQTRMKHVLDDPRLDKLHPMRRVMVSE